jgi:hypothetical protein
MCERCGEEKHTGWKCDWGYDGQGAAPTPPPEATVIDESFDPNKSDHKHILADPTEVPQEGI